ncbi:YeeE/YedE thiosulfate transporter family protein [Ovoidimarina sediminis]|uniref:YeeE/YedE thiosulfate transporter family protein n=1 Tax=Ovoidimarina sediminis TaxID=3079856 RepID=UPI00290D2EF1|nr:YeeE/YedE thiosulfate transporter family protein [Rhodophyticola sp. MJ-SS7]MDU8942678.1 YeeE/YedE thiosulfate transporter family protein [Rhodophyticola sp. MJ-SS7]
MLLETLDLGLETRTLHLIAGLLLGLVFGVAAQISRFCLRRAVAGAPEERGSAAAVWVTGLAAAILGFAAAQSFGVIALDDHRFLSPSLPVAAIALGGLAFGAGMVLTRGCVSRLTVLSATGNLRAVTVLLAFAVTAHATLKGVLAPVRTTIGSVSVDLPVGTLAEIPFGLAALAAAATVLAAFLALRSGAKPLQLALGAVVGLVAVGGWMATSTLLFDEFEPLPVQTAAFTLPWSDSLFWVIASTAIPAGFGVGFIGGVLGGSFLSAAARGELQLQSFSAPAETLRYVSGGVLMGVGGVLAGGCTVGAGLSGTATGSLAALLALASIIAGGWAVARLQTGAQGVLTTA